MRDERPLLIDAFCKAGGASMGYHRAGFRVLGVDVEPQPRYPFPFVLGDALAFLRDMAPLLRPAVVAGSPPCHDHTPLRSRAGTNGTGYLLGAFRDLMIDLGVPYVIENVPGAPMRVDVELCGEMFGLRTVRHRWFESSVPLTGPGHLRDASGRRVHLRPTSTRKRRPDFARGANISVTGDVGSWVGPPCMGIDWMTGDELSQAIPPAYTEHIGRQLMSATLGVASDSPRGVGLPT